MFANKISKIRFGILGCSRVALKGMFPAIKNSSFVELVMIGSRDLEKAKETAARFNACQYGTYDEVLDNKGIDAVYVSLPNALHEEWSIKALESGKHVICEKPAALSYAAGQRMVSTAKKNNMRIWEGFMFRYHPQNMKVVGWIENGDLGNLLKFEGSFGYAMPEKSSNSLSKELGGGCLHSCGVYPIAASRIVFKEEPVSIFCKLDMDPESGVDIKADMFLEYPDGKSAFVASFFGSYYESTYSILGTKASIRMSRAYAVPRDMATKIFFDSDDKVTEIIVSPADHFQIMIDEFCSEILKGEKGDMRYEDDLLAQAKVLEAAKISNAERRIVKISEII